MGEKFYKILLAYRWCENNIIYTKLLLWCNGRNIQVYVRKQKEAKYSTSLTTYVQCDLRNSLQKGQLTSTVKDNVRLRSADRILFYFFLYKYYMKNMKSKTANKMHYLMVIQKKKQLTLKNSKVTYKKMFKICTPHRKNCK